MSIEVQAIRPLLRRSVQALEELYGDSRSMWTIITNGESMSFGRAVEFKEELLHLWTSPDRPTSEALARMVWNVCVTRKVPTVWLLRNTSAEASILFLLFIMANVPLRRIFKGRLTQANFLWLTSAAARLAFSPLGVSEVPDDGSFGERLELARWAPDAQIGVCDWTLSPAEIQTAKISDLRIIAPS